jgi:DNA-binding transcriptional LysR family regulator
MKIRDLSLWEAFYWVSKDRNFTRAAGRLGISPPQLSKRVSALENDLGVRLLHRTTRKVSLTQEGQSLVPHLEAMLEDLRGLESRFEPIDRLEGTIRLTSIAAFAHRVLAPLIAEFSRLHPKVRFDIEPTDQIVDLIENQMDLAIRVQEPQGSDSVYIKLLENNLTLCTSPKYLKTCSLPLRTPLDLHKHPVMLLKVYENCGFQSTPLRLGDLRAAQMVRCESGLFLTQMAIEGVGIAIRSAWDVEPLFKTGQLVPVLTKYRLDSFGNIYVIIPNRRLLAHRVRVFVDFLTEHFRRLKLRRHQ